jgi:hypothetical protein
MVMQSTRDKVRRELEQRGFKKVGHSWRGNHPLKPGSDSQSFAVTFHDGEHGAFDYHAGSESGSLYDLAKMLGIEPPVGNRVQVASTKTAYVDLADYAQRHYAPLEAFEKASWSFTQMSNRPALSWPVKTGLRIRFLDEPGGYRWFGDGSNTNCWYGLNRAIQTAYERSLPLILCNGEASVVVAQHHGLPAFSGTGGEGAISDDMKNELDEKWNGPLVIALDCDTKGREAAQKAVSTLERGTVIDLGLSEKGDLADFCGLHKADALPAIQRLAEAEQKQATEDVAQFIEFVSGDALLSDFSRFLNDEPELFGRTIRMPFAGMREAGGFASIMTTRKVWFIGNISGGGKTILSETLCDEFNAMGYNVFYIGDEWSSMELAARRVQRAYQGDPLLTYRDYLHYANGVESISERQRDHASRAIRAIRERPGTTYTMQIKTEWMTENPEKSVIFLEDVFQAMGSKIRTLRANGQQIDIVVVDYLSLYETRGRANNLEEYKAGVFKAYCKSLDVLGITTVQVNKEAEDRVKHRGGMLNQHDLYWVRPDKANLITTMNQCYRSTVDVNPDCNPSDATKPYLDSNNQPEWTPNFAMLHVKNSVGQPFHFSYFHWDYDHLRAVEGLHPDYYFDKFYQIPRLRTGQVKSNGKMSDEQLKNLDLI